MNKSSDHLFDRAKKVIPGGVNSPVRSWNSVGGTPPYISHGTGSRIITEDGQELIDFCGSWGPLILGHAHSQIVEAVKHTAESGLTFGANTIKEIELAETLCELIPCMDKVRLVNSGTEATMTALRLARGHTGRRKIVKCDGCYHGHSDSLLISSGSGLLTSGIASSAGVPENLIKDVLVAPYNDLEAIHQIFSEHKDEIAAIIIEPVAGNMGLIKPAKGFLEGLRKLTEANDSLLIFDEVISGFRLAPTTYGVQCGVTPDITCLGKIIGGGMPIGALGGTREIMDRLAPVGNVYQAGTLSGNPVAVSAGLATLRILRDENPYPEIEEKSIKMGEKFQAHLQATEPNWRMTRLGGMFTIFFTRSEVNNLADAKRCDTARHAKFFHYMFSRGFYLPPSQFEVCFISSVHTNDEVESFIKSVLEFSD